MKHFISAVLEYFFFLMYSWVKLFLHSHPEKFLLPAVPMVHKVIRTFQGHRDNGTEIPFYGGFPAFNANVGMQLGHRMPGKAIAPFQVMWIN